MPNVLRLSVPVHPKRRRGKSGPPVYAQPAEVIDLAEAAKGASLQREASDLMHNFASRARTFLVLHSGGAPIEAQARALKALHESCSYVTYVARLAAAQESGQAMPAIG